MIAFVLMRSSTENTMQIFSCKMFYKYLFTCLTLILNRYSDIYIYICRHFYFYYYSALPPYSGFANTFLGMPENNLHFSSSAAIVSPTNFGLDFTASRLERGILTKNATDTLNLARSCCRRHISGQEESTSKGRRLAGASAS